MLRKLLAPWLLAPWLLACFPSWGLMQYRLDFFHGSAKEVPSAAKLFQAEIQGAKKTGFSQDPRHPKNW